MPTMLLRRATQVVNRINREAAFEVEQTDDDAYAYRRRRRKVPVLTANTVVSIDGEPRRRVDTLRQELLDRAQKMFRLIEISTNIRQAVAVKQAECGVTSLVTERVKVVRSQQITQSLLGAVNTNIYDPEEFDNKIEAMRDRLSRTTQNVGSADISTVLLTEADRKELQDRLVALNRRLLEIDDQLGELNSRNSVTVSNADEDYLRTAGIL